MNIIRSHAKSRTVVIEEEKCNLCEKELEDGKRCYRYKETNNIICTNCAVYIAVARGME